LTGLIGIFYLKTFNNTPVPLQYIYIYDGNILLLASRNLISDKITNTTERNFRRELVPLYPYVNFKLIFTNPLKICSLFHFKNRLPALLRSNVVYVFTCPGCNSGTYVGSTQRMLKVRIDAHCGVSHRTGNSLTNPEKSSIRSHSNKCRRHISYNNFKILSSATSKNRLLNLCSLNNCDPIYMLIYLPSLYIFRKF
jgi:hypothetical protein